MASTAKTKPAGPDVVGSILLLPVASIEIGKRLRSIDPVWAAALGKVMKAEGQNIPIEVCTLPGRNGWTLVAGAHRLTGAQNEGIAYIKAIVVESDAQKRIEREISENLWRQDLAPLDRAAFVAELVTLHKAKHGVDPTRDGRAVSASTRWQQALKDEADDANVTMTFAYGWADGIADRLGLSRSAIERDLHLHRRIPAGLIGRLREVDHPALRNAAQLRALAKLDEDSQAAAVDRLLWAEQAGEKKRMTLAEAIAIGLAKNKPTPAQADKTLSAFIGAFSRMSLGEKKGALAALGEMLPAGYRLVFGEQPTAKGFSEQHEQYREEALAAIDTAREAIEDLLEDAADEPIMNVADRTESLRQASTGLQLTRFSIVSDAFELGAGS